ncbi:enoyl-CoA hydratase-related protein [Mycobacterium tilburgii]|uniref:enoyl-CoA hydratase-related protein n=1 Tax=Mycobacterium tilburgii TaxID=44467 RepID=UPI003898FB07
MAQSDFVLFRMENRVALITVNDPDRRNALTGESSAQLRAAVERAEADPGVHAVVVTGGGQGFLRRRGPERPGRRGSRRRGIRPTTALRRAMAVGSCTLPTIHRR